MAKTISTEMRTHLDQEVTTLCTCWQITRIDGVVYRFTDSDQDVVHEGQTFESIGAYKRTAIESTATLSVDNLEVMGLIDNLVLPERDLRAGLFDGADVRIFITSWQPAVTGDVKMRRGFFGEVQVMPNGTYQVELRGLLQRLGYEYTDLVTPQCRLDLGEPSCGIPIPKGQVLRSTAYAVGDVVIAPNSATQQNYVGTYKKLGIGDPDFEIAGANTPALERSAFWRNTVNGSSITVAADTPKSGTYAARGGAAPATIVQDIDLIATSEISATTIDFSGQQTSATDLRPTVDLFGWRRDTGGTGQFSLKFLDRDLRELGFGGSLNSGGGKITPSAPIVLNSDFTIEGWFRANDGADLARCGFGGFGFSVNNSSGTHSDIRFDPPRIFYNPPGIVSTPSYGVSSQSLNRNQWYHIAISRDSADGGRVKTYIDGVLRGNSTGYTFTLTLDFMFSTISGFADANYQDVRIWSTVRTPEEVYQNKDRTLEGTEANLIHYWRFSDNTILPTTGTTGIVLNGSTLSTTATAPIPVPVAQAVSTATQQTLAENVGATWVLRSFRNSAIPHGTRYLRTEFSTTSTGNYLDALFGWTVDSSTNSTTGTIPAILAENTHYRCTTAGTTASTLPAYGGTAVTDGTAVFTKDANPWARNGLVLESDGARVFRAQVTDARAVDAWFAGGLVTFETGQNAGVSMEVKDWTQSNGQIELFLSVPYNIEAGDLFRIYPGCDKSRISCAAIFQNILNFRGFPDVPGQDSLYIYPDAVT